jgi:hypothetical protein
MEFLFHIKIIVSMQAKKREEGKPRRIVESG